MDPKEIWGRYTYMREQAATVLREVMHFQTECDYADVVSSFELVALWRLACCSSAQFSQDTWNMMIEATNGWQDRKEGGKGPEPGVV